ncbi:hypothetical protein LEP1GSC202_0692 [Leptospira yanagawae serovar Saopaulo str. Sao Paulo = ATCC 700523]|uniref:Uncharacterized protein n=1 Tax=Leptospira yanagawae serovar Saopaulo str. Sao Paulo = ATCC 700523 TaxID=1249483 RepID=A0A5E8HDI2_9LEPT|nr:hypothetical protein LEP1GSC202_0692 [Leptospira yanagawae serovar Saopaulo str. Sao Paulo = ATCC 700523]
MAKNDRKENIIFRNHFFGRDLSISFGYISGVIDPLTDSSCTTLR